jgi:hypothetical protein
MVITVYEERSSTRNFNHFTMVLAPNFMTKNERMRAGRKHDGQKLARIPYWLIKLSHTDCHVDSIFFGGPKSCQQNW